MVFLLEAKQKRHSLVLWRKEPEAKRKNTEIVLEKSILLRIIIHQVHIPPKLYQCTKQN